MLRQREWDPGKAFPLSLRALELCGEVGELANKVKKLERERLGIRGSRTTMEAVSEELADTIICTDLLAMELNDDLVRAVIKTFNAKSEEHGFVTRLDHDADIIPRFARMLD